MNLRDLQYLVALAEHRHFGKASEVCFVSQPTLSAQIKKLEEELGVQLLERNNKQVLITPIGESLIAQAHIILHESHKLRELAKLARDPFAGQFKLGMIPTVGPYLLPHILPLFKQKLPRLELRLYEDKTERIIEQLQQGKLDAGILALPIENKNLIQRELFREHFYVALPKNHPLSHKKVVKLKDLNNENLLLLEEGHCLADQVVEICNTVKIKSQEDYRATSLEMLRHMVAIGAGLTLIPALTTTSQSMVHVKSLAAPTPSRVVGMIWRKQQAKQACCEIMVKLIGEKVPGIIRKIDEKWQE